mmetsp:Transcript_12983/g.41495  ORF Transcript_12983/g.41495 Transcript_12983/m.41495 type:complete len:244 (-) Transcript_12983:1691-2422(-)
MGDSTMAAEAPDGTGMCASMVLSAEPRSASKVPRMRDVSVSTRRSSPLPPVTRVDRPPGTPVTWISLSELWSAETTRDGSISGTNTLSNPSTLRTAVSPTVTLLTATALMTADALPDTVSECPWKALGAPVSVTLPRGPASSKVGQGSPETRNRRSSPGDAMCSTSHCDSLTPATADVRPAMEKGEEGAAVGETAVCEMPNWVTPVHADCMTRSVADAAGGIWTSSGTQWYSYVNARSPALPS